MERKKRDESLDVFWTRIMSWDGFIAAIDDIEDLTEQEKDQAKEAYRFLSKELNHEFIKELREKKPPIPSRIVKSNCTNEKMGDKIRSICEKYKFIP